MNGAESMLETMINQGVEVCFTNPGTSEMHMVVAIGKTDGMRAILSLFEGVCTGAADGYGRMAGKPACTLLHLGPGLSNGSANLHNANKARSPIINVIGDHATYHKKYDTPLTSDIIGLSQPVSHWVKSVETATDLPGDVAEAVVAANTGAGQISTLIVPANCAWGESGAPQTRRPTPELPCVSEAHIERAAELLSNGRATILLLNHMALTEPCLAFADKIAQVTEARLFCDTFITRLPRGQGRPTIERLSYFIEQAKEQLLGVEQYIMVGTKAPIAFFAYPEKPSEFYAQGNTLHVLAEADVDAEDALRRLCQRVGADTKPVRKVAVSTPQVGSGALNSFTLGQTFAAYLPAEAIVVDEGITSGDFCFSHSARGERHDWLCMMGGSLGYGLPVAIGAAVACPRRKVICIHGDGSAMYTIQSLWTMAREQLDICVVIFANRKYKILHVELAHVGAQSMTKKTLDLLDIDNPEIDFVQLAQGMGVSASRAEDIETFNSRFKTVMQTPGPYLIEAVLV